MTLPDEPHTRLESYLARLAGQEVEVPENPVSRIECYLAYMIENGTGGGGAMAENAGSHNGIFRGESLGEELTAEQLTSIQDGTFKDLYIGDYWTIGGMKYRIAGCDLFLRVGPSGSILDDHHLVIVPDDYMYIEVYDSTGYANSGYSGSTIKTTGLTAALSTIEDAFGADNILEHSTFVSKTVPTGGASPSTGEWIRSKIDLLSINQYIGSHNYSVTAMNVINMGDRKTQFPLFFFAPQYILPETRDAGVWVQDLRTNTQAVYIGSNGATDAVSPNSTRGIRPYFLLG